MDKKKRPNEIKSDAVSIVCAKTGMGRDPAAVLVAKLSKEQASLITPDTQSEQIMQILNNPQSEKKSKAE